MGVQNENMTPWSHVALDAPQLAAAVQARFEAHGLGFVATIRRDGSPRISGVEPLFARGDVWLGMMPNSLKALDLLRDPRFALHCATVDKEVTEGDAKIAGRAEVVEEDATVAQFLIDFEGQTGYPPPPGPFHLFRADLTEVSLVKPAGDHLDIDLWRAVGGVTRIERR